MSKNKNPTKKTNKKSPKKSSKKLTWLNEDEYMKERLEQESKAVEDKNKGHFSYFGRPSEEAETGLDLEDEVTSKHVSDDTWYINWQPGTNLSWQSGNVNLDDSTLNKAYDPEAANKRVFSDLEEVLDGAYSQLLTPEQKADDSLCDMEAKIALATKDYLTAKRKLMVLKCAYNDACDELALDNLDL